MLKLKIIMNVCILGDGLTSLSLAKSLVNLGIFVDIYSDQKIKKSNKSRTIGITKSNIEFFNKNILNIQKFIWEINKIEIYSQNLKNEKVLNFENNNKQLFSIIKNYQLYDYLLGKLKKNKFFNFKKNINAKKLLKQNYGIIINCDPNCEISKKFFYKKIDKDYKSYAYTTIIKHKNIFNNNSAIQIFTEMGPIAFLPISKKETSVVYSARGNESINFKNLIKKYNTKYSNIKIGKIFSFKLKSSNLRFYKYQNILAFGDLLHKIHPLAGQGFNMSIRDIKLLLKLIKFKIDLGMELDSSIGYDFEKKIRHKNYLFSSGIDLIYEIFNLESRIKNPIFSKSIQLLGKNKYINSFFTKSADKGISV